MRESQVIGKRAQIETTSPLHLHEQIIASTKETMDARRDINNRIGIHLQGEKRRVSIRILNIRYLGGPEQNCRTLHDKVVAKAQVKIEFLRVELQIQIKKSGNKHIDTVLARYNLGRALWLSNKPLKTTQAIEEFEADIMFMTQREPNHYSLSDTEKVRDMALESIAQFKTPGTLSARPYWKSPTARWEDRIDITELFRELLAMTGREKEATITANTMLHGLRRHGLHDLCSPIPQQIDQTTFTEMACDELEKMKTKTYETKATSPRPTTSLMM